jgi:hypothetical protein
LQKQGENVWLVLFSIVDSAKKATFIIAVMVAGMIRELSTLQNLLCGQERKQSCNAHKKNFPL